MEPRRPDDRFGPTRARRCSRAPAWRAARASRPARRGRWRTRRSSSAARRPSARGRPVRTAASAASSTSAPRGGRIVRILPVDGRARQQGPPVRRRAATPSSSSTSPDRLTTPLVRDGERMAPGLVGRGRRVHRRAAPRRPRRATARTRSACSGRRARRTRRTTSRRSSRASCSAPTTSTAARGSAMRRRRRRSPTMLGAGAATSSFDDIERARTILVCGANATEAHPVVGARIRQQALRGANLIVIDPRRIELARVPGALHLAVKPGANVPVLNAMACAIVEEGLVDDAFLRDRVEGWTAFRDHVARFRPEDVGPPSGVAPELCARRPGATRATRRRSRSTASARPSTCRGPTASWRSSTSRSSPATSASPGPASTRCAARTTCRAPRTWAASRARSPARRASRRRAPRFEQRLGRTGPDTARSAPARDDGGRGARRAQGAVGDRLRRAAHQPERRRHPPQPRRRSSSSSSRTSS